MIEQQSSDLIRRLVDREMTYARQLHEPIGGCHKLLRSLCCHSADGVIGITPNE